MTRPRPGCPPLQIRPPLPPLRRSAAPLAVVLATAVIAFVVTVFVPSSTAVTAQGSGTPAGDELLSIASISPWVEPDGEFQVRFDPARSVPADADLTVTIHQSIDADDTLRESITEIIEGRAPGPILQRLDTRPIAELGDPAAGSVLTIPVRSRRADSERVLVPNPGIHPVHLAITEPDGPELWSQVVFLNRLPAVDDDEDLAAPVQVTLLLPVSSQPAVGIDGGDNFTLEERSSLTAIGALLEDAPNAPLTVAPRPNTLDGLMLSGEPWGEELLSTIGDAGANRSLLALPYTATDTGGLIAAGASDELRRQIDLGRDTLERIGRRAPWRSTWALDDTVTAGSLSTLARAGIDSMILPATAMELPGGLGPAEVAARPVRLAGDSGIRALAVDGEISGLLAGSTSEPGTRAHEVITMLMATWFDHSSVDAEHGPASVVLVTESTDPLVLEALAPSLESGADRPLVADPRTSPVPEIAQDEDDEVVSLVPRRPTDQRGAVQAMVDTRRLTDAYRSMTAERDRDLWAWERINDQTMSSTIDDGRRLEMHLAVRGSVEDNVDAIELPTARRVVVTSRESTIPLRFRNDLDFDVELMLRARSPRLDIEGGRSHRIVLHPGENRIDLPVTVQAPGESSLRIELSSPVPGIHLEGPDVPVQSTAISGVGAALSIVSVLFLIGWWVHTHRRDRRKGVKLSGVHPSSDGGADSLRSGG